MTDTPRTTVQTQLHNHPAQIRDARIKLVQTLQDIADAEEFMKEHERAALSIVIESLGDKKSNAETREIHQARHLAADEEYQKNKKILRELRESRQHQEIELEYLNNMFQAYRAIAPLLNNGGK